MIRLRRGVVTSLDRARPGLTELTVSLAGRDEAAIAYPELTGEVRLGDTVLVNTTAVALGLGTGGAHFVIGVEGRESGEEPLGHVMKARYTPVQTAVRTVEESDRDVLEASDGLGGMPVVCAPLHSMIAPAAAAARVAGARRVVYVMTDGAALPGALSHLVVSLRDAGLLDGWITCGQAFGGELEAVTIWTALLAARELLDADVVVVADGPGNLGTDTTWGVTALAGGHALNATTALGGRPVPALRVSFADERERHRGLSHHSVTILRDVCTVACDVPVPTLEDPVQRAAVWDSLRAAGLEERHHLVEVDGRPGIAGLASHGVDVTSMGRGPADDPAFFLGAGAAGVLAGRMAAGTRRWRSQLDR
ncbi:MAG: DUF3866 family protein [Actinomycetota bacterium]